MRKIFLLLLTFFVISSGTAFAAVTPGGVCSKPGAVQVVGKTTFVCASVGKKSVWITTGTSASTTKPTTTPKTTATIAAKTQAPTPTCNTGVGNRLSTQIVNDQDGLAVLQIKNPTNCTISYSISGPLVCNHYKGMRDPIGGMASGTLYANQTATLYPRQAFQLADQTCQQMQRASGAGPEYGAGILAFSSSSYPAFITGISN